MIGPTFGVELAKANLDGLPFSWTPNGLGDLSALTNEQQAAVQAVLDAHNPLDVLDPVPSSLTRRQLLIGLMTENFITAEEAVASAQTGEVPSGIMTLFNQLEDPEKTAAIITWASMSVAERDNPLVESLRVANALSVDYIDTFFRTYSQV